MGDGGRGEDESGGIADRRTPDDSSMQSAEASGEDVRRREGRERRYCREARRCIQVSESIKAWACE